MNRDGSPDLFLISPTALQRRRPKCNDFIGTRFHPVASSTRVGAQQSRISFLEDQWHKVHVPEIVPAIRPASVVQRVKQGHVMTQKVLYQSPVIGLRHNL